jgi:type II secretion system protein H
MTSFPNESQMTAPLPCSGRPGHERPRGFTLIELLLVLVFIAAMAGVTLARLGGAQEAHALRGAAADLATSIRFAAAEARIRARGYRVVLTEDHTRYHVETVDSLSGEYRPVPGLAGLARPLGRGVAAASWVQEAAEAPPPAELPFGPAGQSFSGTLVLRNRVGETVRIVVMPETSQVHVDP